jgi:magnesium-transporting ATPase (P-type)
MKEHAEEQRSFPIGKGSATVGTDNAIYTSKYTLWNFLFIAVREQFRRNGNLYFLVMGCLMFLGTYTTIFTSSVSPWTTLGPLAIVISISLCQEAAADIKRHRSDVETNEYQCTILRRREDSGDDIDETVDVILKGQHGRTTAQATRKSINTDGNKPIASQTVTVAFTKVKRMDIRAGDIVLVKNREMIPADIVLLASSGENGASYIETSPIDGETNLKLRNCPQLPIDVLASAVTPNFKNGGDMYSHPKFESIEKAVRRITRFSLLGFPNGVSTLYNPKNTSMESPSPTKGVSKRHLFDMLSPKSARHAEENIEINENTQFVTALTSELPNASVNTFSGKMTVPSIQPSSPSIDIPLGAENILLRGAVLRNTEWALGVACYCGSDSKLAKNSIKVPSKFSRLDELMNRTVLLILFVMLICVLTMSVFGYYAHKTRFDQLWYAGYGELGTKWPYHPELEAPKLLGRPPFYEFVLTYITLLNNFVPLSLYVTVEMITLFMMLLIGWDKEMYHKETDTPAVARSTIVSDLGQVKYIFSDKTGTLTQNIMKFKRCSVDGMIFGAPIEKKAPGGIEEENDNMSSAPFHPLKRLLIGGVSLKSEEEKEVGTELAQDGQSLDSGVSSTKDNGFLTFNAEMFLRVMSICHTVVVEKEIDTSTLVKDGDDSVTSAGFSIGKIWNRSRTNTEESTGKQKNRSRTNTAESTGKRPPGLGVLIEGAKDNGKDFSLVSFGSQDIPRDSEHSIDSRKTDSMISGMEKIKSEDGSPYGYAYQAESPDEGALVSAASIEYDFQVIARTSDGVKISCSSPSLLSLSQISKPLSNGQLSSRALANETSSPVIDNKMSSIQQTIRKAENKIATEKRSPKHETWAILAVNKFDSDRKRMSVVVRSPPHLGSIPMLFCKGADSSMLDASICEGGSSILTSTGGLMQPISEEAGNEMESSILLNLQSHLGTFASEGLRTLVLGVRILSEKELEDWMVTYHKASTAINDRNKLLTAAAKAIETNIHIVGATAIEDKLQDGVPDTIYNIGRAGIKLWVLTGDKRETAIEIGYSTRVLNPKMHVTEVAEASDKRVKALVAMEFMRLVKIGKLNQYQYAAFEKSNNLSFLKKLIRASSALFHLIGKLLRSVSRICRLFYYNYIRSLCGLVSKQNCEAAIAKIHEAANVEKMKKDKEKRVRHLAEKILQDYLDSEEGMEELKMRRGSVISEDSTDFDGGASCLPTVFTRAHSARASLDAMSGVLTESLLRSLALASVTADNVASKTTTPVIDADALSLESFLPGDSKHAQKIFSKKKRTILEKMFAIDRDVRKGHLVKHLTKHKKQEYYSNFQILPQGTEEEKSPGIDPNITRALVIEGSALAHFLGDDLLEEMLFAVASNCESVIACRVSPKQKALLVKLVKQFVSPVPVTLAIGDGANDVGMIQEAHVGVGISGLEGQQAVNSSDFAIAQFRFLENLLLVHGRWDFMRLSKVVLFSFYKNAVLAGLLIVFSQFTVYSGTPLFDMWVLSAFNFVCGIPILLFGMFDRDLDKEYVKSHPHLYAAGPNNEHMCMRKTLRWVALIFIHVNIIFYLCRAGITDGGSITSAFKGLMMYSQKDQPGDGDGGDLKVFGTTVFMVLNWMLALKVLLESGSIIYGNEPAITCRKNNPDGGFWSRAAYTWHGIIFLSIGFNFVFLYAYEQIGKIAGAGSMFSPFVGATSHTLHTRSIVWIVIILATIAATVADLSLKVFSNMFYPTQTQIHKEISVLKKRRNRNRREKNGSHTDDIV